MKRKWKIIYEQEAARFKTSVPAMLSKSRKQPLPLARWRAWERMRHELGMSLEKIGDLACRDHSTVIHGLKEREIGNG